MWRRILQTVVDRGQDQLAVRLGILLGVLGIVLPQAIQTETWIKFRACVKYDAHHPVQASRMIVQLADTVNFIRSMLSLRRCIVIIAVVQIMLAMLHILLFRFVAVLVVFCVILTGVHRRLDYCAT
jgi:hypothetical protein